jgi:hypothetical protein
MGDMVSSSLSQEPGDYIKEGVESVVSQKTEAYLDDG